MKKNTVLSMLKYAGSLIIDQFLAVISAVLITEILRILPGEKGRLISYFLCSLIYIVLLYTNSWQRGNSDINRIRLGFISRIRFKGVFAGLIAIVPSFVIAILAYTSELRDIVFADVLGIDLFTTINRLWQLPLSFLYEFVNKKPVFNLLLPFFVPIVSGIGYAFGQKEISLKQILFYKDDEK